MSTDQEQKSSGRREVLKKAAYSIPAILSLTIAPSFAMSGSGGTPTKGKGK